MTASKVHNIYGNRFSFVLRCKNENFHFLPEFCLYLDEETLFLPPFLLNKAEQMHVPAAAWITARH